MRRAAWPTETKLEKRCFELLRAAYAGRGIRRTMDVTAEELAWFYRQLPQVEISDARRRLAS